MGGKFAFPFGSLYHGTKFAVEGISESLNFEVAGYGVRVKLVEPGATATDFAGRSFDFKNDKNIVEYQELMQTLENLLVELGGQSVAPRVVAEKIYEAATDGTDQLRYPATPDAIAMLAKRDQQDDATFISELRKQFGL